MLRSRARWRRLAALLLVGALACADAEAPAPAPGEGGDRTAWVEIAGQLFELELALDAGARMRGLSGRRFVPASGGMLFVNPFARRTGMVMRDCPIPIDVAFLDREGRVLAMHAMSVEPPRRRDESAEDYEARLPVYDSGVPAQFAVETAGGRLRELGLRVGDRLVFDAEALLRRAARPGLRPR